MEMIALMARRPLAPPSRRSAPRRRVVEGSASSGSSASDLARGAAASPAAASQIPKGLARPPMMLRMCP
eukprot:13510186-Heterocapsa_arctica.AAC.1